MSVRDIDVQAILDEISDDDDEYEYDMKNGMINNNRVLAEESYYNNSNTTTLSSNNKGLSSGSNTNNMNLDPMMELERILREQDDDDDDEDNDNIRNIKKLDEDSTISTNPNRLSAGGYHNDNNESNNVMESILSKKRIDFACGCTIPEVLSGSGLLEEDGRNTTSISDLPRMNNTHEHTFSTPSTAYYGSHNSQDWALLQSILREKDDDDSNDSDDVDALYNNPNKNDIDQILQSIQEENNSDNNNAFNMLFENNNTSFTASSRKETNDKIVNNEIGNFDNTIISNRNQQQQSTTKTKMISSNSSEEDGIKVSSLALKNAETYEEKLLRPLSTIKDIVSPLQIKRRMKKPNYNLTESSLNNNESSISNSSSNSVSTLPPILQLSSAYAIHCKLYKNISTKLKYNSSSTIGISTIGLPTCLAISVRDFCYITFL